GAEPAVQVQHSGLAVTVVGKPGALALKLVGTGTAAPERSVPLPETVAQGSSLSWYGDDRLAVLGMANSSISAVVVVDGRQAKLADYFLGIAPVVSPDGRYIAFVKFYPSHGIEGIEDRVRLYDLAQSALRNRPVKSPHETPE